MKTRAKRVLSHIILSILLIFTSLFASSCFFDPDEAINIQDSITHKAVVQTDSTVFYFYYASEEHPIDEYSVINVGIDYYADYSTPMKKKNFLINVPDDVIFEEQPYFTVEIEDALNNESVVYLSFQANYKSEDSGSKFWIYALTVVIAIVMLVVLFSTYSVMCETFDSNSSPSSLMWLGGLILYVVVAAVIGALWGTIPSGIIIGSAVLYFISTLIPYFKYKL